MKGISCVIIEDELDAVNLLRHYINKHGNMTIAGVFDSALKAQSFFQTNSVDLIFLDVELPGLSGIDFVRKGNVKSKMIFTTAFKEYAVEGFDLAATDYLLKPFSYERFARAIERFHQFPETKAPDNKFDDPFIIVTHERRPTKIHLSEILWAEAQRNCLYIACRTTSYKIHTSISEFMDKLPTTLFARVHRSFIVSIREIESINSQKVVIRKKAIPVGRNYSEIVHALKARFAGFDDGSFQP
jgi:DNA-binding LytR/AlgR family response regulator